MPTTYEPIATTTVSAAASLTFNSIPATYTDLRIVYVNTATNANNNLLMRFNSDTASNYSWTEVGGNGITAASARASNVTSIMFDNRYFMSQTVPSLHTADIFKYASSTFKTALCVSSEDYNGAGGIDNTVGVWRSTSAITSVTLLPSSGTFTGTATIYGIKAA